MPKKKVVPLRDIPDGWSGLRNETVEDFKSTDREGYRRLTTLGARLFPKTKDALIWNLCLISFEPKHTSFARAALESALTHEFDAAVNLLTFCRLRFLKLMSTEQGLAELHLTGASLLKNLSEAEKDDLTYKRIPDLLPITKAGIKNALPSIMKRRKDKNRGKI